MTATPYLSIVIPSYNEEKRLKRAIPSIVTYLSAKQQPFEIIIVDDGSKDNTGGVTKEFSTKHPEVKLVSLQPNQGKGGAVKTGMLEAKGQFVLFTDADQSTPIEELDKLLIAIEQRGYDMAIGSRAAQGAEVEESQVWYRALAGKLFGIATKALCVRGIADTQCGFKCMKRSVAQKVFSQVTSSTAIFDIEMLVVTTREGFSIAEIPVKWVHDTDTRIPYNLKRAIMIWLELFRICTVQKVSWPLKAKTHTNGK